MEAMVHNNKNFVRGRRTLNDGKPNTSWVNNLENHLSGMRLRLPPVNEVHNLIRRTKFPIGDPTGYKRPQRAAIVDSGRFASMKYLPM